MNDNRFLLYGAGFGFFLIVLKWIGVFGSGYYATLNGVVLLSGIIALISGAILALLIVGVLRLTADILAKIFTALTIITIVAGELSDNPAFVIGSQGFVGIVGFFVGFLIIFSIFKFNKKPTIPIIFGSSRWANQNDLNHWGLLGSLRTPQGLLLGESENTDEQIIYKGEMHTLTIAPTRAGKGACFIIPNLLRLDSSILVIDPKGENARRTAAARVRMGQDVYIVDPWGISQESDQYGEGANPDLIACYNPLDSLDASDPDLASDVMIIADALVIPSGGDNRFWDEEAKGVIFGFILHLVTEKKESKSKNLGRLRDILTLPYAPDDDADVETMTSILVRMSTSKNPLVRSSAARLMQKDDKERSGVISSAQANTHFLDSPMLRKNLERSDFSFKDLKTGDKPVTVYLVLPLDRLPTFNRWLRLNVVTALKDLMRIPHPKDAPQVRVILDEFAALERLDIVEKAYGTMAGLGVQLCAITQDLAQMERLYGKSWQTFISNAGVFQYFGSRDKLTADYASSLTGVATMKKRSLSMTSGSSSGAGGGGTSSSETTSYDDVQRPLAFPDELMTMPRDRQLLFIENRYPISSNKIYWYKNATLTTIQSGRALPEIKIKERSKEDITAYYNKSSKKVSEPVFTFDLSQVKKFFKTMIEPQKTTPEDFAKARKEKAEKNAKDDKKD
ncbi:MAG: hypothetical protein OFPII_43410 [Osedax symbiont Rs1]|nr:MAG: hypothetical protein OFPII_43410 [Osedax symbiont Rs1]